MRNNKIPLEERLKRAGKNSGDFQSAFKMSVDSYFYGWDEIMGGSYFESIYEHRICSLVNVSNLEIQLSSLIACSEEIDAVERLELLYRILIEPFAKLEMRQRKSKNKENDKGE